MKLTISQFAQIMEKEGIPFVYRYKLWFALKECQFGPEGFDSKWGDIFDEDYPEEELFKELEVLAQLKEIQGHIKYGRLSSPDMIYLH